MITNHYLRTQSTRCKKSPYLRTKIETDVLNELCTELAASRHILKALEVLKIQVVLLEPDQLTALAELRRRNP